MARGSRCQHRSFVGTSLLVETVLESGSTCCHARSEPERRRRRPPRTAGIRPRLERKGPIAVVTYLEVILNTQRDSESEQQNDVDMTGADAGANGAAAAASGASAGTGTISVTGEKKKAQEEAKRRMERI